MPRQYTNGGREPRGSSGPTPGMSLPNARTLKERFGALRNLRPFIAMVWRTSPGLTASSLGLRLARALLPVVTLYIGKLIIDDVVLLVQMPDKPQSLQEWFNSGLLNRLIMLLADGKVEAAGTHVELMSQSGRYAELFELQAAGYR